MRIEVIINKEVDVPKNFQIGHQKIGDKLKIWNKKTLGVTE
jgi:hypothetical protein